MKRLALLSSLVLIGFASVVWSQSGQQPAPAPAPQPNPENFVGKVTGHPTTDIRMLRYSFEPGARTNWHSHEGGQVILIEKGTARAQEAGAAMREIGPRESFVTAPGVKHWHGAMPNEPLTQVSLSFGATNWMEKVSDQQVLGQGQVTNVRGLVVAFVVALLAPLSAFAQDVSGEAIYKRRCAACHERPADGRTPGVDTLRNMPSSRILRTLDFGAMMTIAYQLNRVEREAVARFLGKAGGDPQPRAEAFCSDRSVSINTSASPIWNGWSPSPNNSRFSPAALSKLTPEQVSKLKLKWAFGFEGDISAFCAADSDWQSGLHWQRRRRGARAARGHRLSAVDVPGCGIDSFRDGGRASWTAGTCCSSAISLAGSTRSTQRQVKRSGASGPRNTKPFV